jgi:hypothetical protein
MNARQAQILRLLAHFARTAFQLNAIINVAPHVVAADLEKIAEAGYAIEPIRKDGRWEITAAGRYYLAQLPNITPSTLICNASTPSGSYKPKEWQVREGGNDHAQFKSRGIGA